MRTTAAQAADLGPSAWAQNAEQHVQVCASKRLYASRIASRIGSCAVGSPFAGRNSAKLRRSPFTEYCRAGNVTFSPPVRRSQMLKPINLSPLSGPASDSKITSASASFPAGLPFSFGIIFTDTSSPLLLDMGFLQGPPRAWARRRWDEFAEWMCTPANEGGDA